MSKSLELNVLNVVFKFNIGLVSRTRVIALFYTINTGACERKKKKMKKSYQIRRVEKRSILN